MSNLPKYQAIRRVRSVSWLCNTSGTLVEGFEINNFVLDLTPVLGVGGRRLDRDGGD